MEFSIQELAKAAGTTSRTLRHYDAKGLLAPSRTGSNGYRYYDQEGLVRLQRILLLRELGLGLAAIADVLDGQQNTTRALRTHLELLEQEQQRIGRQIESVRTTLRATEEGGTLMPHEALDGFDHTRFEQEVTERWGREAYEKGDRWWRSLSDAEKRDFQQQHLDIARDYAQAVRDGEPADGDRALSIAARHRDWLEITVAVTKDYFIGLGEMYVADPRFTEVYDQHGAGTAEFVRDAMRAYADRNLA